MTLKAQLDAFKAIPKPQIAEFAPILSRTIANLAASGQAAGALRDGQKAPEFTLSDQDENLVSSVELLKKGAIVLTFYRGVWCPFCNIELKALEQAQEEIKSHGATLLAISQQTIANNRKSRRENNLTFPVLTDKGGDIGAAFGLRWVIPQEMRDVHIKLGGPIPSFNGEDSWTLPMPARYVIGQDGIIVYAEVNPDYTQRPEPLAGVSRLSATGRVI